MELLNEASLLKNTKIAYQILRNTYILYVIHHNKHLDEFLDEYIYWSNILIKKNNRIKEKETHIKNKNISDYHLFNFRRLVDGDALSENEIKQIELFYSEVFELVDENVTFYKYQMGITESEYIELSNMIPIKFLGSSFPQKLIKFRINNPYIDLNKIIKNEGAYNFSLKFIPKLHEIIITYNNKRHDFSINFLWHLLLECVINSKIIYPFINDDLSDESTLILDLFDT